MTTPRSDQPTLDWAKISVGLATRPIPAPMTKHTAATCQIDECALSRASRVAPAPAMTAPITAVALNPIRRYSRPDWDAAIGQPMVMVASAKPAASGPCPSTSCR